MTDMQQPNRAVASTSTSTGTHRYLAEVLDANYDQGDLDRVWIG